MVHLDPRLVRLGWKAVGYLATYPDVAETLLPQAIATNMSATGWKTAIGVSTCCMARILFFVPGGFPHI
ncbi:hypothetical protein [Blastomonas fulva]|jgi:hypothetical protein|uniref:hypothetical protein n=1 Tax=Blastomonas fulva TaxID=1550728 RepID=UPI003D2C42AA